MTYKEKVAHAEKIAERILSGESREQVQQNLEAQGIESWNIKKILSSADNMVVQEIKPIIKEKLISGGNPEDLKELININPETRTRLISAQRKALHEAEKRKIRNMLKLHLSHAQVSDSVNAKFLDQEKVRQIFDEHVDRKRKEMAFFLITGAILMFYGLWAAVTASRLLDQFRILNIPFVLGFIFLMKGIFTRVNKVE